MFDFWRSQAYNREPEVKLNRKGKTMKKSKAIEIFGLILDTCYLILIFGVCLIFLPIMLGN
jgi:hypothetical protein